VASGVNKRTDVCFKLSRELFTLVHLNLVHKLFKEMATWLTVLILASSLAYAVAFDHMRDVFYLNIFAHGILSQIFYEPCNVFLMYVYPELSVVSRLSRQLRLSYKSIV